MAARNRNNASQPPRSSPAIAPDLSVARSSPLSSTSLGSYPITTASFTSSPILSSTHRGFSASPDLIEGFEYCEDMDDDFRRIDLEVAEAERNLNDNQPPSSAVRVPESLPLPPLRDQRTWVVFHGKAPGVYAEPYVLFLHQTRTIRVLIEPP